MAGEEIERINEQPRIIVEPYTSPDIERRIASIDKRIHKSPEEFQAQIANIGSTALETIKLNKRDERVVHAARNAGRLIKEYLENRYDLDAFYDKATEDSLSQNPVYSALVEKSRAAKNYRVQTGVQTSEDRPASNAEALRDAVRIYRLQAYINRVAAYRAQTNGDTSGLPSAG